MSNTRFRPMAMSWADIHCHMTQRTPEAAPRNSSLDHWWAARFQITKLKPTKAINSTEKVASPRYAQRAMRYSLPSRATATMLKVMMPTRAISTRTR